MTRKITSTRTNYTRTADGDPSTTAVGLQSIDGRLVLQLRRELEHDEPHVINLNLEGLVATMQTHSAGEDRASRWSVGGPSRYAEASQASTVRERSAVRVGLPKGRRSS